VQVALPIANRFG